MTTLEQIDSAIGNIEQLYRSVVGREAPPAGETPFAPIPPEKDPQQHVEEQLDRLLGVLGAVPAKAGKRMWAPCISAWEGPQEIVLFVDLPGVSRERVNVSLTRGWLEVSGERDLPVSPDTSELRPRWVEVGTGRFHRVVPLPLDALAEQLQARLQEGVLEIRIPRTPAVAAKTVPVT